MIDSFSAFCTAAGERLTTTLSALQAEPATWLCATLIAYAFGLWAYKKSGFNPLFTPLLVAIVLLVGSLLVTHTDYKTYFAGGSHIHFLLSPATVALAVPLYEQRLRLAKLWLPLTCGLFAGATVAIVSAVGIAGYLGADIPTMISLAPKSVTVPIAMTVSEALGGIPALTATLVVMTGVLGSLMCRPVFAVLKEKDEATRGFALGLSSHGLGTAAAFQMSRDTGAFSGLAMGLTGLVTAFLAPLLVPLLLRGFAG